MLKPGLSQREADEYTTRATKVILAILLLCFQPSKARDKIINQVYILERDINALVTSHEDN